MLAVMLRVDNGGSATVLCEELVPDPIFPDHIVLKGILGLSWPVAARWMYVNQWSVKKNSVLNWMAGPVRHQPELELEALTEGKTIPWPEGTNPNESLVEHPEVVDAHIAGDVARTEAAAAAAAIAAAKAKKEQEGETPSD